MRLPWTEPPPTDQRSLKDALQLEYDALWRSADQEPVKFERIEDYYAAVHREAQAALCLSGGGVRSAAFGLGVLQALAGLGLLDKFQYLSTVSGGGYISGWLSRWIRDADHQVGPVAEALASASTGPRQGPGRGRVDGEPLQIAALRERSNFLTPHVGVASKDSWAALAIVARNLLLNWLVFVPTLMAVALLFQLYRIALYRTALDAPPSDNASMLLGLLGAMLLTGATFLACRKLPSHAKPPMKEKAIFW